MENESIKLATDRKDGKRKLVISFPGGRGDEIPLLYFGAKVFEDRGYEKIFVRHPEDKDQDAVYENVKKVLQSVPWAECENVIFIGKSLGTLMACRLKEELGVSVPLILFTPLPETLPYMRKDSNIILAAAGTEDRYLDAEVLRAHCETEQIPCYIEPGVGHRMEVMNDLPRNLEIVGNVIGKLVEYVEGDNAWKN